jgi:hypothetical protein
MEAAQVRAPLGRAQPDAAAAAISRSQKRRCSVNESANCLPDRQSTVAASGGLRRLFTAVGGGPPECEHSNRRGGSARTWGIGCIQQANSRRDARLGRCRSAIIASSCRPVSVQQQQQQQQQQKQPSFQRRGRRRAINRGSACSITVGNKLQII